MIVKQIKWKELKVKSTNGIGLPIPGNITEKYVLRNTMYLYNILKHMVKIGLFDKHCIVPVQKLHKVVYCFRIYHPKHTGPSKKELYDAATSIQKNIRRFLVRCRFDRLQRKV